jgi:hypothetical protein
MIGYDLRWTYALWRRNDARRLPVAIGAKLANAYHGAAMD